MKLSELAAKPKLVQLTITEPTLVEKYGEELSFHVFDRQPLDVFAKMSQMEEGNTMEYVGTLSQLILNEEGEPVMNGEFILPLDVLTEALKLIGENLGK